MKAKKTRAHPASKLVRQIDVATELGVGYSAVKQWAFRGHLPAPDWMVWDTPAWKRETIQPFIEHVRRTGSGAGYNGTSAHTSK